MEPITFELIDGYLDSAGKLHRLVRMRQLTMADQIAIKADLNAQKLLSSKYSIDSPNQVERMFALTEFNEFYCIVFKQTVLGIGELDQAQLRAADVFTKLSARDIGLMIQYQNGSGGRMIRADRLLQILRELKLSDALRLQIIKAVQEELGEAPAAADAS